MRETLGHEELLRERRASLQRRSEREGAVSRARPASPRLRIHYNLGRRSAGPDDADYLPPPDLTDPRAWRLR